VIGRDDTALRAQLLGRLAGALRDQPSLEPRTSLSREAVGIARRLGEPATLGYALLELASAAWGPDPDEFAALAVEAARLAEESGDPQRILQTLWPQYIACQSIGDRARATEIATRYEQLADELRQPDHQWYATALRSFLALFEGRYELARQLIQEAVMLGERAQSWEAGASHRMALFGLRRDEGRLDEIEGLVRSAVDDYPGFRVFPCLVALLEVELERADAAREAFARLTADGFAAFPRDNEWLFNLCVLGEVATYVRDLNAAEQLYELLLPYAPLNALGAGDLAIGSVAHYLALLAGTMSDRPGAARHFETALELNERMSARPWLARTQVAYARMLLEGDERLERARGNELLERARATYRELGLDRPAAAASVVSRG
jgi:tetratricopeptide (TPR) repeat protein